VHHSSLRASTPAQRTLSTPPVPPSVPAVPSMETSSVGAPAMEEGMGSRDSSMARSAGGDGMPCRRRMQVAARVGRCMRVTAHVGRRMPGETPAINMVAAVHLSRMEIIAGRVKTVAIYDGSTMRNEALVIIDGPATMPITSPVVPTPAVAGE
jgi:hypothetical protein